MSQGRGWVRVVDVTGESRVNEGPVLAFSVREVDILLGLVWKWETLVMVIEVEAMNHFNRV